MATTFKELNGTTVEVFSALEDLPLIPIFDTRSMVSGSGEVVRVARSITGPFQFVIMGEKLGGVVDVTLIVQEAILHVLKENAKWDAA